MITASSAAAAPSSALRRAMAIDKQSSNAAVTPKFVAAETTARQSTWPYVQVNENEHTHSQYQRTSRLEANHMYRRKENARYHTSHNQNATATTTFSSQGQAPFVKSHGRNEPTKKNFKVKNRKSLISKFLVSVQSSSTKQTTDNRPLKSHIPTENEHFYSVALPPRKGQKL